MRTRFLNTDYFSSSSWSWAPETLGFLNLPVPDILYSRLFCNEEDERLRFGSLEDIPLHIDELPIEAALSKFMFDVVPDHVDVEHGDFEINGSSDGGCCFGDAKSFGFGDSQIQEKENGAAVDNRDKQSFQVIQFETPELDFEMEKTVFSKEELRFLSDVPEIRNELDDLGKSDVILQKPDDIQQNFYAVDYISSDYFTEQNTSLSEEECSLKNKTHSEYDRLPLLEVDEICSGILSGLSMEDELLSFLEKIESRKGNEENYLLIDGKELIGSVNYDLLEFLFDGCHSENSPESDGVSMVAFTEMDIISILETSHAEQGFQFDQEKLDVNNDFSMIPVTLEEFQVLDMDASEIFEIFICLQRAIEPVACEWMFREEMGFKNFAELVVSPELALTDDTFKSLPIPIICDHEKIRSLGFIFEDILSELKPQPLSTTDDIYLDWHLLDEDRHSHEVPYNHAFKEIDSCSIDFNWESLEEKKLVFDFIFSDDAFSELSVERGKESLSNISTVEDHRFVILSGELTENSCPKSEKGEHGGQASAEKASFLLKSMSAFDDLAFFLNPQKAMVGENVSSGFKAARTANHQSLSCGSKASRMFSGVQSKTQDFIFHSVSLSDDIIALVGDLEKSYLALLQDEKELISALSADKLQLLSIPKGKLMDCIRKAYCQKKDFEGDDKTLTFALLLAIKQITWYMCFFGIHVAHLFLNKLCQSSDPIKLRLHALCSSVETAQRLVGTDITRSHPSLATIRGILQSHFAQSNSRALILAEQVFWSSLKRLLMPMGLTYDELKSSSAGGNQTYMNETVEFKISPIDSLPIPDCLLVSHEQVSPSFPLENFRLIIEYGGSYGASRISSPFPELATFPHFHFIKVDMDRSNACGVLCEGVEMLHNLKMTRENETNVKGDWLEELLNFAPLESMSDTGSSKADKEIEFFSIPLAFGGESGFTQQQNVPDLRTVIVVNTQNFDKKMIISRRSTYQKVLAMEREGVQVVERDSDIPVDLMLGSAICLLWYDCQNTGKKTAAADGTYSSLLSWIEDIATNILTLLSFTFSCCIMVFEGGTTFLTTIMESSDELYAAAASLGINLQIFCSLSMDLTDEIILRCIKHSVELTHCLHAKMLESETLAESFLTKFPSVNPLTAHAILSSGVTLLEFLKLPHDSRVQKMQKYDVPEESVDLFSALCRYGAREDSKSVMTDSSSSISSGPNSDTCHFNVHSVPKRQKYTDVSQKMDTDMDGLLDFEPPAEFSDAHLKHSQVFQPHDSWTSRDPQMFNEQPRSGSSSKGMFRQENQLDFAVDNKLPGVSQVPKGVENWDLRLTDEFMSRNPRCKFSMMDRLGCHETGNSENIIKAYKDEVIDIADCHFPGEGFLSTSGSDIPSLISNAEKDFPRKPKIASRLFFGKPCHPSFPTASEIDSSSRILVPDKDPRKSFSINDDDAAFHCNNNFPLKRQKSLLEEILTRRFAGSKEPPFRDEISHCGRTPLSNALHSSDPQGSPWTIEFLNRIRERSRTRQQARPSFVTPSSSETPGNVTKATKRKSPSMLEFFKYKGGNTPTKLPGQKRQKQSNQSSSSSKNKNYSTPLKSWTPIDKRAKQSLSFAMNGTGSQTKLVWN